MQAESPTKSITSHPQKLIWAALLAFVFGPFGLIYTSVFCSLLGVLIYLLDTFIANTIWTLLAMHIFFMLLGFFYTRRTIKFTMLSSRSRMDRPSWRIRVALIAGEIIIIYLFAQNVQANNIFTGLSMLPTISKNEINRNITWLPRRRAVVSGDIVSFSIANDNIVHIARIVALGDQTVKIRRGLIYVNGKAFDDPVRIELLREAGCFSPELRVNNSIDLVGSKSLTVPVGMFFAVADNRADNFQDSRAWGPVPMSNIKSVIYPNRHDTFKLISAECRWPVQRAR